MFAEPHQVHAFADREIELARLYGALVDAGNAVLAGRRAVRHKHVIHGYVGVGKSALIMQALGMIRGEVDDSPGQRVNVPDGPEPKEPHRWLILHVSGKHAGSIEALTDLVSQTVGSEINDDQPEEQVLNLLSDVHDRAEEQLPAIRLGLFHRLFRHSRQYQKVRSSLSTLAWTIDYVRIWRGATETEKLEAESYAEKDRDAEFRIEAELRALAKGPDTAVTRAGLKAATGIIKKHGSHSRSTKVVEREWRVGVDMVVDALNGFFRETDRARIPTIMVLDDFDELVTEIGLSPAKRSRVLSWIQGPLNRLAPTCLVLGLRKEFMNEDIARRYHKTDVPPMSREAVAKAIEAWAEVQQPALAVPDVARLKQLGDHLLARFPLTDPVAVPFRFLQLVAGLANSGADPATSAGELLQHYLNNNYSARARRAILRVAQDMPEDDVKDCAAADPLEPEPYALTKSERGALESEGLLRPAMAGDENDPRIILDPICAYLHLAQRE